MENKKLTTRELVMLAVYAALFITIELVQNQLGLFEMPNGGSLSVSAVILLLASYHLGYKKGIAISLLSVVLQFITGYMHLTTGPIGFFLDYVLAYGIYGIASLLPNIKYFYTGVLITNLVRFFAHTISGMVFYQTKFMASMAYNATYMVPTTIVAIILVPILHQRLKKVNLIKS